MSRKRLVTVLCTAVLGGGLPMFGLAQPSASENECVGPEARSNVETCPAGAPASGARAGEGGPTSHLIAPPAHTDEAAAGPATTGPSVEIDIAREAGISTGSTRAWDLLQREIETAERIIGRTRDDDPRGAEILLRLAETYFEAQQYWNSEARGLDDPIHNATGDRLAELTRQQTEAEEHVGEMRENAIRTYARLVEHYPDFDRMDEVLFSLAYGLDEMERHEQSRSVYMRLIKNYPESRFVPHAWLSFAEYYFNDEGDMEAARQFYSKVLETPPESNPVYGYALYRQAWVLYNLEDFAGSLAQFVRVIEFGVDNPDARDVANLIRQSRLELVLPYSRVGRPNQALAFFRRYATDDDQAFEMLESLAELYYDTGQWPETIQVYHTLMSERESSDRLCYWQSRVAHAVVSSRPKDDQVTEVTRLVDLEEVFREAGTHPAESVTECRGATAQILFELAVAWHREAIGTDASPGTNDRNTMRLSAQLYSTAIEHFPDMEELDFTDTGWAREDWPTAYRVSYFLAELYWRMDDWDHCGPAFDRVVELNPTGEYTADAAYAAVLCYDHVYAANYAAHERDLREDDDDEGSSGRRGRRGRRGREEEAAAEPTIPQPQELNALQTGMLGAFTRYVCYVGESDDLPLVKYRRGRIFYESHHYAEAAVIFRDIAFNHPTHELGVFAARLYLDSLATINTRDTRPACLDTVEENIEPLSTLYCATDEARDTNTELCTLLSQLRCDVMRLQAEAHHTAHEYREAAALYVSIARDNPECGHLDEVLYNAAIDYEAARLLGRAIQVRNVLIRNFAESPLAQRAIYLIGANYHALAIYSSAAEWYERFAREFPTALLPLDNFRTTEGEGEEMEVTYRDECTPEEAADPADCAVARLALENAVFFRIGLGDEENIAQALEDAELYERNYRRAFPRETSQVMFSLGTIYERAEDWQHVFTHYHTWMRDYGRRGLPHEVIRAHVQMGRAEWESDERDQAETHFRAAVRAWEHGAADAIASAEGSDDERALWLARAKDAASEAYFYLAELSYHEFRAIHFPRFDGATTLVAVNEWSAEELVPWLTRKFESLHVAETAYNLVAALEVPQWQIAAAARVGSMYRSIVEDVRSAPIPDEIAEDAELEGIYLDSLESVLNGSNPGPDGRWDTADDTHCSEGSEEAACQAAPIPRAMNAFQFCLILATRVRWFSEWSQLCEVALNELAPADFPLAAEIRGVPGYIQDVLAPPGPVELRREESEDESGTGDSAVTGSGTSPPAEPAES